LSSANIEPVPAYTYDAENRLIKVDAGNTAVYTYDGEGHRASKDDTGSVNSGGNTPDPSGTTEFVYDPQGHLVNTESPNGGGGWRGEVFAGNRHLATYNGNLVFNHADWLGTARNRDSPDPNAPQYPVNQNFTSLPFGDWLDNSLSLSNDWTALNFTGQYHDFETDLDYFGARYYASTTGRFMSPDPDQVDGFDHMGSPQAWNAYAYVLNNPLNAVDPDGLDYYLLGGDRCGQDIQCDKQGFVLGSDGNRQVVTDQQINGSNGLAKIDGNGNLQINTAQGTFQGQFFDPNIGANGAAIIPQAIVTPSYEEQKFMALQDAGAMATPGVNAALAITAPQLIFMGGATIALSGSGSTLTLEAGAEASEGQIASISRTAAQAGRRGVQRALRSYQKRLAEHLAKLNEIKGDPGSVQREINNFRGLIKAAEEYLSKNP
jgi:RHS repeat-associated protein